MKAAAMLLLIACLLACTGSVCGQPQPGSPWPMLHHDQYHTGRSPYNGPETPALKWVFSTEGGLDGSPVISSDGTIYIIPEELDNYLYAINPDGSEKWRFPLPQHISYYTTPAIGMDGTIYVQPCFGFLALNPDGTLKWETIGLLGQTMGPVIGSDGTIYVADRQRHLFAFNPDGTRQWVIKIGDTPIAAPSVGPDGTIYVGGMYFWFSAVNHDGTLKWELTGDFRGANSFSAQDSLLYAGSTQTDTLYAITPEGTIEWRFCATNEIVCTPSIGEDGTIYFGSYDWPMGSEQDSFYAVYPDGSLKWAFPAGACVLSSAAIDSDGTVFFCTQRPFDPARHNVYALNPDGTLLWSYGLPDEIVSSPAIGADGTLYVGCRDGNLYAIGEATGTEEREHLRAFRDELRQNSPNPFVASGKGTVISYGLARAGEVSLSVYDVAGRLVETLMHGNKKAGYYSVTWDGRDHAGSEVPSGTYFFRLAAGNFTASRKMVVLK